LRIPLVLLLLAAPLAAGDGWTTLFDGRTLDGWVTKGGRYDGNARWTVEDGAIVGREGPNHAGGLLYTAKRYRNFELELDAFVTWPFDSGIFLRMRPDAKGAQVTLDYRPGGEVGGIYADGWWYHNPAGAAAFKRDGWNRFRVRCAGDPMHVQVWMNGVLLTDYRFPEDAPGFARDGLIGLQVHGARADPASSRVMFRNLRVRELPETAGRYFSDEGALTDEGKQAGWRALVDWKGAGDGTGFRYERIGEKKWQRAIAFLREGNSPYLVFAGDYRDFHLKLDFRIARMANSGVFLRARREGGNPAFSGCEIQILDDFNWEKVTGDKLKPWQFTGSLYGAVPPRPKDALRPLGEWNTLEVIYKGSRIATALNGNILYDVDTFALDVKPPFRDRAKAGFIGLQRHAPRQMEGEAYAWFRDIWLRELR